jgi:cyclic pyranopterin phosphate synthase
MAALIGGVWQARTDRYSELRTEATAAEPKAEMSFLGG